MKKKILVYTPFDKVLFRDLVETNFYSNLENFFEVTWLFADKPKKKIKNISKKNIKILSNDKSLRQFFWTLLFYLKELKLYSYWKWPNLNTKLYLSNRFKLFIDTIYNLKLDYIVNFLCNIYLKKTFKKLHYFKNQDIFINIGGGKELIADDLTRNAKCFGLKTIFIPAAWDNVSSKPLLEKPDKICVWGKQSKDLCIKLHKMVPEILGSARFDIYNNKVKKKISQKILNLDPKFKYILVSGSSVVFNEKRFINKLQDFLIKSKLYKYRLIYRPHPFSQKRLSDDDLNMNKTSKKMIILDPTIKDHYQLKYYPYLLNSVEGIITPFSTMVVEGLINKLPCLALGYFEKDYTHFNWKSFVLNAPHLRILKKKKFIIFCTEFNEIEKSLKKFLDILNVKSKYNHKMISLANLIVHQVKKSYSYKLKNIILKNLNAK